MMELVYSDEFLRSAKVIPSPQQRKLARLLDVLREHPFHPSLHTKHLSGPLLGLLSFRITRDWRVMFQFMNPKTSTSSASRIAETCIGEGDVVGIGGLFPVDMKFFYEADTNRMPVRRIRVEWGDNKGSYETGTPETNSFPNRRGSVRDQATGALTPICSATATTFGESTDACVGKPFSMSYEYTCAGRNSMAGDCTGPNQTPGNAAQKKGGCWDPTFARPGGGTGACVFVPRVHVKDNWGFCNGRCPNVQSYRDRADGERCFDGTELAGANNVDECDASPYPASSGAGANLNPWTYFQGRVIVGPP